MSLQIKFGLKSTKITVQGYKTNIGKYAADPLDVLMNGYVKTYLGIPDEVTWGGQSGAVFQYQAGDFMKDIVDTGQFYILYN